VRHGQIIFQGHQWTCRKCHHKNWLDLKSLSFELSCGVCKEKTQAPVDFQWLFRPNEFLIESLRDHSVLSLLWVLSALRSRARKSFIFVGPTCLGFSSSSQKPDAEVELLALVDGEAILCEVKSSWRGLRNVDIQNFVALARRLRPDKALLAVMEAGNGPRELMNVPGLLAAERIEYELLTPNTFSVEGYPMLGTTDEIA
jgi:hypothetical protein